MGKQQQSQFSGILSRFPEDAIAGRAAQDHEQAAGDAVAPSLRADAPDRQWSQQPGDDDARQEQPDDHADPRQAEQAERGGS